MIDPGPVAAARAVHFIGIGGAGMSALAHLLLLRGVRVTGSDAADGASIAGLRAAGASVRTGPHQAGAATGADLVVFSAAVAPDNVELAAARASGARVVRRAELLGALTRSAGANRPVAIAGAHGKTTTTAMTAAAFAECGLDPTAVLGGTVGGRSARDGRGGWIVVEADEFDRSFLEIEPEIAVVNNIDREHLETYRDLDDVKDAFVRFAPGGAAGRGVVLVCADDPHAASIAPRIPRRTARFGLSPGCEYRAVDVATSTEGARFRVLRNGAAEGDLRIGLFGVHNVRNALAAAAATLEAGGAFAGVAAALADFRGVDRRFETLGARDGVLVVDDYAHHPAEVAATLAAARQAHPARRLVALFQPHLYSRTRDHAEAFAEAFAAADLLVLAPIYGSREAPIPGVTSALIAAAVRRGGAPPLIEAASADAVAERLATGLRPGDLLITMGAGDVRSFGERLLRGGLRSA